MGLVRNRGSKAMRFHDSRGRFARPVLDGWTSCESCGRFYEVIRMGAGPFPMPEKVTACPHCGKERSSDGN